MTVIGDARRLPFPDGVAQCVVTSPPYYGLRDYGIAAQIGLEQTPAAYVAELVAVFREVWRVLRDDGVAWLNIGDSYSGSLALTTNEKALKGKQGSNNGTRGIIPPHSWGDTKPKDLLGIPWRVAFALQSDSAASPETMRAVQRMIRAITDSYETREQWPDKIAAEVERLEREYVGANAGGWYLRSDCIWHKPNPMPESVTDRPTKAHEYVFLLSKQARYYYDAEAVAEGREPVQGSTYSQPDKASRCGQSTNGTGATTLRNRNSETRNARTVWTIATRPYSGAHFATMPPALAQKCILAGTSERGACPKCGAAWVREVERTTSTPRQNNNYVVGSGRNDGNGGGSWTDHTRITTGWRPACDCNAGEPVPCVVLDPFSGAGTTERVAIENGRRFIGTELNPKYVALRSERVAEVPVRML